MLSIRFEQACTQPLYHRLKRHEKHRLVLGQAFAVAAYLYSAAVEIERDRFPLELRPRAFFTQRKEVLSQRCDPANRYPSGIAHRLNDCRRKQICWAEARTVTRNRGESWQVSLPITECFLAEP